MLAEEIRNEALGLSDRERAQLAAELLGSLPPVLDDEDDGVSEAMRRSKELDENPESGCSWDEIKSQLGR